MKLALGLGEEVVVSLWSLAATRPGAAKLGVVVCVEAASPAHVVETSKLSSCFFPEGRKEARKRETQKDELENVGL